MGLLTLLDALAHRIYHPRRGMVLVKDLSCGLVFVESSLYGNSETDNARANISIYSVSGETTTTTVLDGGVEVKDSL